jgi:thioredoxin-related protein
MLARRSLLLAAAMPFVRTARAEPTLGDDGLYSEPWFLESFLELADDLAGAAAKGKSFVVSWELKGCPYCRETHLVNFADPATASFIKERFEILQLNILGAREVTDFDGEKLTEKQLSDKYAIRFTPTFQFFPDSPERLAAKRPRERELLRTQGYLQPKDFLASFRFVAEKAYERGSLRDYLRAQG